MFHFAPRTFTRAVLAGGLLSLTVAVVDTQAAVQAAPQPAPPAAQAQAPATPDSQLASRIQKAIAKDAELRASLGEHERIRSHLDSLTPREREVLDLMTLGKQNKSIAQDLGVSPRTVEIHRARVMEKMNAQSVAELVRMMLDIDQVSTR